MKKKWIHGIVILTLVYSVFLTFSFALREKENHDNMETLQYALVDGNVENPGFYQVDSFSTNLDVLQKAGLNDSSDIRQIDLSQPAVSGGNLDVGTATVKLKPNLPTHFDEPRVTFFIQEVVLKQGEKVKKSKIGTLLNEGDAVLTRKNSAARLTFRNSTELDISDNTKLNFTKIDLKGSPTLTSLNVESGTLRVYIPNEINNAQLTIFTPHIRLDFIEGNTEALIMVSQFSSEIHTGAGVVKVSRLEDGKETQVAKGQYLNLKMGQEFLEPVAKTFSNKALQPHFKQLYEGYAEYKKYNEEVSILLTSGTFNLLVSLIPAKRKIILMDIPSNTYVGDYMDGVFRLDQAMGLAGVELCREVMVRLIGRPIKFVGRVTYNSISNFAYLMDGVMVEVDPGAGAALGIPAGYRNLKQEEIVKFLNPFLEGGEKMAINRQKKVIRAFFDKMKNEGLATYTNVILALIRDLESNLTTEDGVAIFKTYTLKEPWNVENIVMPVNTLLIGPMVLVKPDYDRILRYY